MLAGSATKPPAQKRVPTVHIGLIGLGKMGFNMRERLRKGGIEVTGFDRNPDVTDVATVDELIAAVPAPRLIWVMVPSGEITDAVITELGNKLDAGDLVIDGGNSRFTEDQKHGAALAEKGIRFADCGVSGGVWGLQNGYGLMAGGDAARHRPCHAGLRCPPSRGRTGRQLRPCGRHRRRPLRQDGPQRHRIRADAGLRRRL